VRQTGIISGKLGKRILVVFSVGCGGNGAGGGCAGGEGRSAKDFLVAWAFIGTDVAMDSSEFNERIGLYAPTESNFWFADHWKTILP
jgi:hypothetical protein